MFFSPLTLHLALLVLLIPVILYGDHQAFLYLTGKKQVLEKRLMTRLHYAVWAGLLGMIGTGLWMAWPAFGALIAIPSFAAKMGFVALLVANAFVLGSLIAVASETPFKELSTGQKVKLLLSGAASSVGWIGALTAAFLTFGWLF